MDNPVFCLLGPTASGKTNLAMRLADSLPIDIISVDSALVYRHMDIGTAKPSQEELSRYPHQLIDLINPDEIYSAAHFLRDAHRAICNSIANKRVPVLVGGTMMYFQAMQKGLSELPGADKGLREKLFAEGENLGWPSLHQQLADVDPRTAANIHPHDQQRIQRALEVFYLTGKPLSELTAHNKAMPYCFENILLLPHNRTWLHQRIAQRFEQMLTDGLVAETESIIAQWPKSVAAPAMRMVGYRQVYLYLQGLLDKNELSHKGIAATRQLAKRQMTWLRRWPDGRILDACQQQNDRRIVAIVSEILDNWHF